jgi:hypothetical protein
MFTDVSEVLAASIIRARIMEAASTTVTALNFDPTTRLYNSEDGHIHTRHREKLKSYLIS